MISDPEDILSNTGVSEKAVNNNKLYCGYLTYFVQQPWSFSSPCAGHQNVDLKQTNCQIFLQKKKKKLILNQQRIWGLQTWQATYKPLHCKGRRALLWKEEEIVRAAVHKEPLVFHWPSSCNKRKGVCLLPLGLCFHHCAWDLPSLVSQLYIIEVLFINKLLFITETSTPVRKDRLAGEKQTEV